MCFLKIISLILAFLNLCLIIFGWRKSIVLNSKILKHYRELKTRHGELLAQNLVLMKENVKLEQKLQQYEESEQVSSE